MDIGDEPAELLFRELLKSFFCSCDIGSEAQV
jgi:hypothetical protein